MPQTLETEIWDDFAYKSVQSYLKQHAIHQMVSLTKEHLRLTRFDDSSKCLYLLVDLHKPHIPVVIGDLNYESQGRQLELYELLPFHTVL